MFGFFKKKKQNETIEINVVGESFSNDDGSSRQEIIERYVKVDEPANLKFYKYKGKMACSVSVKHGQIGHLPKEKVPKILKLIKDGANIGAGIQSVGISSSSNLYGVKLYIQITY